ncbi:hypothetical protein VTK56DRAFT_8999 [Thermocarpiscus australiensis]
MQSPSNDGSGSLAYPQWTSGEPRTSSTHSLVASMDSAETEQRRKLLVVYIHGFMGNNSSFRSFPAHVHSFLKETLAESHVVHTKIYPRYKTYKSIDIARENFSSWLAPHESPTTDVVLVGHSMGGLLAADVVLLPSQNSSSASSPFRHRILGTVSLDAPLLGLHPGIVVSGIASLFRPAPTLPTADDDAQTQSGDPVQSQTLSPDPVIYSELSPPSGATSPALTPLSSPSSSTVSSSARDPFFNPPFFNDVAFVDRGWFKNIVHFVNKHKEENLIRAAATHLLSHLEFGGCLADYPELKTRYNRLRRLEDVDEWHKSAAGQKLVRVRFVNYYTVSTGPLKERTPAAPSASPKHIDAGRDAPRLSSDIESRATTPRVSIEDYSDGQRRESLQILEPMPEPFEPPAFTRPADSIPATTHTDGVTDQHPYLPTIPDLPSPPEPPDLDEFPDKESRKQAEKDFKRAQKAYSQAVKVREKAIKQRQKALDKQHRRALKDAAAQRDKAGKGQLHESAPPQEEERQEEGASQQGERKKKLRKFCMLPPKVNGCRDPTWVEVFMEGVDEVGAHCGLFLPGPHYERLVGDVGERIAAWVREDASRRAILDLADV